MIRVASHQAMRDQQSDPIHQQCRHRQNIIDAFFSNDVIHHRPSETLHGFGFEVHAHCLMVNNGLLLCGRVPGGHGLVFEYADADTAIFWSSRDEPGVEAHHPLQLSALGFP